MEREVQVLSIAEFCEENRISRSRLYQEFLAGTGPRHFYAGKRKLITREASADWRRAREAAAAEQQHQQRNEAAA
jgi:hypothetical protein